MKGGRKSRGRPPPPPASASLALSADNRSPFQYPSCRPGGLSLRLLLCPIALPVAGPSLASWKSPLACSLRPRAYSGLAAGSRPTGPAAVRSPDGAIPSRGRAPGLQGAWRSPRMASVSCCLDRSPRIGRRAGERSRASGCLVFSVSNVWWAPSCLENRTRLRSRMSRLPHPVPCAKHRGLPHPMLMRVLPRARAKPPNCSEIRASCLAGSASP